MALPPNRNKLPKLEPANSGYAKKGNYEHVFDEEYSFPGTGPGKKISKTKRPQVNSDRKKPEPPPLMKNKTSSAKKPLPKKEEYEEEIEDITDLDFDNEYEEIEDDFNEYEDDDLYDEEEEYIEDEYENNDEYLENTVEDEYNEDFDYEDDETEDYEDDFNEYEDDDIYGELDIEESIDEEFDEYEDEEDQIDEYEEGYLEDEEPEDFPATPSKSEFEKVKKKNKFSLFSKKEPERPGAFQHNKNKKKSKVKTVVFSIVGALFFLVALFAVFKLLPAGGTENNNNSNTTQQTQETSGNTNPDIISNINIGYPFTKVQLKEPATGILQITFKHVEDDRLLLCESIETDFDTNEKDVELECSAMKGELSNYLVEKTVFVKRS